MNSPVDDKKNVSLQGLIIWLVCALFFMYEFLLRTVLGTFEHPIMYSLNLNFVTFAILSSTAYQVIYGCMQLPVGLITDRIGLKKTLFFATLICAAAVFGFGLAKTFYSALVFRMLMSFGSAFGFVGLLVAVYDWLPRKNIALFIGLSQFIGTMGPMLAAGPLHNLAQHSQDSSWRYTFWILAIVGVIIAALIFIFVKNNSDHTQTFEILQLPGSMKKNFIRLIKQPHVWAIAIYSGCTYFTIEYLSENSGQAFLVKRGYGANFASYMITVSWIGYAISCPLLGFISDATTRRKPLMVVAGIVGLLAAATIFYLPINAPIMTLAFFLLGIGAGGQNIGFAIMTEQCNNQYLAAGLGFNNGAIMLISATNAPLIGWILISLAKSHHLLVVANYQKAFLVIIAFMSLGVLISIFFLKETFCKSTTTPTKLSPDKRVMIK